MPPVPGPPSLMSMRVRLEPGEVCAAAPPGGCWSFSMEWHCPPAPAPGWVVEVIEAGSGATVDRYPLDPERSSSGETEWSTVADTRAEVCFDARVRDPSNQVVVASGPSCVDVSHVEEADWDGIPGVAVAVVLVSLSGCVAVAAWRRARRSRAR